MEETFKISLDNWLKAVDNEVLFPQSNKVWIEKYGHPYVTLEQEDGLKFVRIVSKNTGPGRSAWAFVAKDDGFNKQLGAWKKGDIFKPTSYKVAARHVRGNIFDISNGPTCNIKRWTGPEYLRG
jgi:hypothetical protein